MANLIHVSAHITVYHEHRLFLFHSSSNGCAAFWYLISLQTHGPITQNEPPQSFFLWFSNKKIGNSFSIWLVRWLICPLNFINSVLSSGYIRILMGTSLVSKVYLILILQDQGCAMKTHISMMKSFGLVHDESHSSFFCCLLVRHRMLLYLFPDW